MSLLIYIVIGAIFGDFMLGNKLGRQAMLVGAVMTLLPEMDRFIALFMSPINALEFSNSLTHSLLILIISTPLMALLLYKIYLNKTISVAQFTLYSFWAMAANLIYDLFTIHGIALFAPFFDKKIAFSSIAEVDYYLLVPLIVGVLVLLVFHKKQVLRKILHWFLLLFTVLYLAFTVINKVYITSKYETNLFRSNMTFTHIAAFPTDGSNFNWYLIARNSDGYWEANTSNFTNDSLDVVYAPKNEVYLIDYEDTEQVIYLKEHSRIWYSVSMNQGDVFFIDLRYGKIDGDFKKQYMINY